MELRNVKIMYEYLNTYLFNSKVHNPYNITIQNNFVNKKVSLSNTCINENGFTFIEMVLL